MDFLVRWVKNLILIILFTTLLEMFLPESSMRKYVRVVMGFFIITILLSPLASIFNQDLITMYKVIPGKIIDDNWDDIKRKGEELEEENKGLIRDYYGDRMEQRIEELVALDYPDYKRNIKVNVNEDYQLTGVKIGLSSQGKIKKVNIDPVVIGEEAGKDEDTGRIEGSGGRKEVETEEKKTDRIYELKHKISRVFQIPLSKIEVIVKGEGG